MLSGVACCQYGAFVPQVWILLYRLWCIGVTNGGRWRGGGRLPPGAAGEGAQNSLDKNILWQTITKVSIMKFAERAISTSLSQQTFAILNCQQSRAISCFIAQYFTSGPRAPHPPPKKLGTHFTVYAPERRWPQLRHWFDGDKLRDER